MAISTNVQTIISHFEDGEEYAPFVNVLRELYKEDGGSRAYIDMKGLWSEVKDGWHVLYGDVDFNHIFTREYQDGDPDFVKKLWDITIGSELNFNEHTPTIVNELLDELEDAYTELNEDADYEDLQGRQTLYDRMIRLVQLYGVMGYLYDAISNATRSHQEIFYNPLHRSEESKALKTAIKRVPDRYLVTS